MIPHVTVQKMKFFVTHFFCKCEQIRSFLQTCSHLPKKFLTENFNFMQCVIPRYIQKERKRLQSFRQKIDLCQD